MQIQLIRNATMKITYAGRTILTDPLLAPKGAYEPFAGKARNPTADLPISLDDVLKDIDGVLVSHMHSDHFDKVAGEALPKNIPLFHQPGDEERLAELGFTAAAPVADTITWEGITISRTGGAHGSGEILEMMGQVSGFVLQADGEPTMYWAGDTIFCEPVENAIRKFKPDVFLPHSGGAQMPGYDIILMDAKQTLQAARTAWDVNSESVVVAIHMEALDHCPVTRDGLRNLADQENVPAGKLMIPKDGETLEF